MPEEHGKKDPRERAGLILTLIDHNEKNMLALLSPQDWKLIAAALADFVNQREASLPMLARLAAWQTGLRAGLRWIGYVLVYGLAAGIAVLLLVWFMRGGGL